MIIRLKKSMGFYRAGTEVPRGRYRLHHRIRVPWVLNKIKDSSESQMQALSYGTVQCWAVIVGLGRDRPQHTYEAEAESIFFVRWLSISGRGKESVLRS